MTRRTWDYIENRLLAPAEGASEAYDRLNQCEGYDVERALLMTAMTRFNDDCRDVRARIRERRQAQLDPGRARSEGL